MLNVKPRNLLPVDSIEWLPDFPPDFDPRAFCASLQDELSLRGLGLTVLDWTPLASTIADVVHLVHMAHGAAAWCYRNATLLSLGTHRSPLPALDPPLTRP